jgi:hypothetical protein
MRDGTDTPTQASRTSAALELLALLTERYPEAFRHEGEPPQALAIGTGARRLRNWPSSPTWLTAMRLYTRRRAYQQVLAQPGAGVMKKRVIPPPGIDPVLFRWPARCQGLLRLYRGSKGFCTKRAPVWWKRLQTFVSPCCSGGTI